MKNKLFIIFAIHILQGSEEKKLPPLGLYQSLKETSHKNIILSSLASLSLGLLTHKFFPKNKLWLKKTLTGAAIITPMAISAARTIYFGKTKNENIFKKYPFSHTTKHNIFLERSLLLSKKNAKKNSDNPNGIYWKKKFKEIKKFITEVNELTKEKATQKQLRALYKFSKDAPNVELTHILLEKIIEIEMAEEDFIQKMENLEQDGNNYFTWLCIFYCFKYTKENAIDKITKFIEDPNFICNIDDTQLGQAIKQFMIKNNLSDEEIKELIKNNKKLDDNKKESFLQIFSEKVFSQAKKKSSKKTVRIVL